MANSTRWERDDPPDLSTDDAFGVAPLVDRIQSLLSGSPYPFTVALSGSWGAGKTTVTRELVRRMANSAIATCSIDLWTEDIAQLRRTVVIEVGAALRVGASLTRRRLEIAKELDEAVHVTRTTVLPAHARFAPGRILRAVRTHKMATVALIATYFASYLAFRAVAPELLPALSTLLGASLTYIAINSGLLVEARVSSESQSPAEGFVETQTKFASLVAARTDADTPVLVIVDNIDRLSATDALTALREIRTFIEIPQSRCVFLVPIDRGALVRQLKTELGGPAAARDYLDKFFNVDIPLTEPEVVDLRDWIRQTAFKMFGESRRAELAGLAQVVALGAARSPRVAKRILNGVYTRTRLVDATPTLGVPLAAFALIETLLIRFPGSIDVLLDAPRQFIDLRDRVRTSSQTGADATLVLRIAGDDRAVADAVNSFLSGSRAVTLSLFDLRNLLSLREERYWKGIGDAPQVVAALESGNSTEMETLLDRVSGAQRAQAVVRVSEWIRKSAEDQYTIFAFNGLNALCGARNLTSDEVKEAQELGLDLLGDTPDLNTLSLLSPVAATLIARSARRDAVAAVGKTALSAITSETPASVIQTVLRLIRGVADVLDPQDKAAVQSRVANYPHEALEPLFEKPVETTLIDGDIANRYATELASLDLTPDGLPRSTQQAARLAVAKGWKGTGQIGAVATRLAAQIAALPELTSEAMAVVDDLVRQTSEYQGTNITALVTGLATWNGPQRARTLAWAVRHPVKSFAASAKAQVEAWLNSASPEQIGEYEVNTRGAASREQVSAAAVLASRWLATTDVRFAELSSDFDAANQSGAAICAALRSATAATAIGAVRSALEFAKSRAFPIESELVSTTAHHVETLPIDQVAQTLEAVVAFVNAGVDVGVVGDAYVKRVATASKAELSKFAELAQGLADQMPARRRDLLHAFAARCAAVGSLPLDALGWISTAAADDDLDIVIGTVGAAIRRGDYVTDQLLPQLRDSRAHLRSDGSIRVALVAHAAKTTVPCEEAQRLLGEARSWHQGSGDELEELDRSLSSISERCPSATDEVVALRAIEREDGA